MADPALDRSTQLDELRGLLKERFPGTSVLDAPEYGVLPSGIDALDSLLPGGAPRGAMTLLTGPPSSGKLGAGLALAARWTQQGGQMAWMHGGSLSAPSAAHAGVDLRHLLAVRTDTRAQSMRCLDYLLRWQAFGLVVADWIGSAGRGAAWGRLQKLVTGSRTALVMLARPLPQGDPLRYAASVHIGLQRRRGRGGGGSSIVEADLLKSRYGRPGAHARLEHGGLADAPFPLLPDLPGLLQEGGDDTGGS